MPIHDVQALLKTKGSPAGTPAPPEQHPLKRRSSFGAVGCQRNRPADGNSCTLFNEACLRSATSTAPGLDAQSSKDGKRCGLWLTSRGQKQPRPQMDTLQNYPCQYNGHPIVRLRPPDSFRRCRLLSRGSSRRRAKYGSYLVDPASSHMLVSKIKPCMSKYKLTYTVKLRMAH